MQADETSLIAAEDAFLARLEQPNAYQEWEVEVELAPGLFVDAVFLPDEDADAAEGLVRARQRYLAARAEWESGKRAAAEYLLDLYNDEWSDEDEPISADQFAARVKPVNITLYSDGRAEIYYDDGGMFLGHIILVPLDANGVPQQATLTG